MIYVDLECKVLKKLLKKSCLFKFLNNASYFLWCFVIYLINEYLGFNMTESCY